jgi:hypothetical protein
MRKTDPGSILGRPVLGSACVALALWLPMGHASGQTTAPPNNPNAPTVSETRPVPESALVPMGTPMTVPMPAAAAMHAAVVLAREPLNGAVERAMAPAVVSAPVTPVRPSPAPSPALSPALSPAATSVGPRAVPPVPGNTPTTPVVVGAPLGEGVRVLRAPGGCTPKTNSLDCVQDSSEAAPGANVSGRVRHSVIGEVGSGRAATEGGGGAQRQPTCTPKPGELSCAN